MARPWLLLEQGNGHTRHFYAPSQLSRKEMTGMTAFSVRQEARTAVSPDCETPFLARNGHARYFLTSEQAHCKEMTRMTAFPEHGTRHGVRRAVWFAAAGNRTRPRPGTMLPDTSSEELSGQDQTRRQKRCLVRVDDFVVVKLAIAPQRQLLYNANPHLKKCCCQRGSVGRAAHS